MMTNGNVQSVKVIKSALKDLVTLCVRCSKASARPGLMLSLLLLQLLLLLLLFMLLLS